MMNTEGDDDEDFEDKEPPTQPSTPAARRTSVEMAAVVVPPAARVPAIDPATPDTERDDPNLERVDATVFEEDPEPS